jgi:hypothetical protein
MMREEGRVEGGGGAGGDHGVMVHVMAFVQEEDAGYTQSSTRRRAGCGLCRRGDEK